MALDTRDYFLARLRKRLGYVERASFRMGEHEKAAARRRAEWRRVALLLAVLVAVIVVRSWLR